MTCTRMQSQQTNQSPQGRAAGEKLQAHVGFLLFPTLLKISCLFPSVLAVYMTKLIILDAIAISLFLTVRMEACVIRSKYCY